MIWRFLFTFALFALTFFIGYINGRIDEHGIAYRAGAMHALDHVEELMNKTLKPKGGKK